MKKNLPKNAVAVFNENNSVIVVDDGCYVIMNWDGGKWGKSAWIFQEALQVLDLLPDNPRDALASYYELENKTWGMLVNAPDDPIKEEAVHEKVRQMHKAYYTSIQHTAVQPKEAEMKKTNNHTEGPWVWSKHGSLIGRNGYVLVQNLAGDYGFATFLDGGTEDNMRLVAAAPDLLNALTVLADACERMGIPVDAARAAIAKARGE